MSSPQPNSYNAPTGRPVYAGRVVPGPQNYEHLIDEFAPAIPNLGITTTRRSLDLGNQGGDRPDIGLYTEWQAEWLAKRNDTAVSQAEKDDLKAFIIQQADEVKDLDWWVGEDMVDDMSHRPNIFFLPALLTNDEQQRQDFIYAMRGMVYLHMRLRQRVSSDPTTPNILYQLPIQERSWAWLMREYAQLAYLEEKGILTDSYLNGTEFRAAMDNNLAHIYDQMARPDTGQLGWLGSPVWRLMDGRNQTGPMNWRIGHWQQGFCGQVVGHILKLGFTDWLPVAEHHMKYMNAVCGGKWPLRDADGDYVYFNTLMEDTYYGLGGEDAEPEERDQLQRDFDIYANIPLRFEQAGKQSISRWSSSRAAALTNYNAGNGWPEDTIVNKSISGTTMTYENRLDNRLSALGLYADAGVTGAKDLVLTLKEQRQLRIDRGGAQDNKQYKNTLEWKNVSADTPTWIENAEANTWGLVPLSVTLADIDPIQNPELNGNYPGTPLWAPNAAAFPKIISAWNGACFDPDTGDIHLPLQGGHGDYYGNDYYKLVINSDNPSWTMVKPPTGALPDEIVCDDGQEATGVYADGRLRPPHNYNKVTFIPGVGPVMAVQGNVSVSATAGTTKIIIWDKESGDVLQYGPSEPYSGIKRSGGACYDSARNGIWFRGSGTDRFSFYSIDDEQWQEYGPNRAISGYSALEYAPDLDLVIWHQDDLTDGFGFFDFATNSVYEPGLTAPLPDVVLDGTFTPRWVSSQQAFFCWNNDTNPEIIYKVAAPANPLTDPWIVSTLPVSASNEVTPTAKSLRGTYGRFMWIEVLGVFVLFNDIYEMYFFKPEFS